MNHQTNIVVWLLVGAVLGSLSVNFSESNNTYHMDTHVGGAEESSSESFNNLTRTLAIPLPRRNSASGHTNALRWQSLNEIGETPPRTRLISYPVTSTPDPSSSTAR